MCVWEPESKVIWVGNGILEPPQIPWLLDAHLLDTLQTTKKLYDFLPPDATVIPGHGNPMKREDVLYQINYLTELKGGVENAIKKGMTLEETTKKLTEDMKKYRAYKKYDWVHVQVNIPKSYEELKKKK